MRGMVHRMNMRIARNRKGADMGNLGIATEAKKNTSASFVVTTRHGYRNYMRKMHVIILENDVIMSMTKIILREMKDMADGIGFYGMENAGICDLTECAAENLGLDWRDDANAPEIDAERERLENNARDAVRYIREHLDMVMEWMVLDWRGLSGMQKLRLCQNISELSCCGAKAMEKPSEYIKCVVAEYALHDDTRSADELVFAIENALHGDDE